ncbi:putative DNA binding protein [Gordonia phage GMA5]|uniref:Putative DNA binding protein n=1 Tax=Gordonia phage GMA5 TaxID=1647472 RepID=A0A0K0MX67_9CAUD|nr:transcriptional repressor [Gordonia phage GMA5]AKI28633.1 putative DNA binding protein [Gordonia phage GMA5]
MTTAIEPGGVTSGQMAEYVGVTPETMSRYLSGKYAIPVGTLRLIALRTGVPFHWLETGHAPSPDGDGACEECAIRDSNPEPADLVHPLVAWGAAA